MIEDLEKLIPDLKHVDNFYNYYKSESLYRYERGRLISELQALGKFKGHINFHNDWESFFKIKLLKNFNALLKSCLSDYSFIRLELLCLKFELPELVNKIRIIRHLKID